MNVLSSIIHNRQNMGKNKCSSVYEQIKNMKKYSAIRRNETVIHVTIWINLENIIVSERSQSQKAKYCIISFLYNVQNSQIHRDRK